MKSIFFVLVILLLISSTTFGADLPASSFMIVGKLSPSKTQSVSVQQPTYYQVYWPTYINDNCPGGR